MSGLRLKKVPGL